MKTFLYNVCVAAILIFASFVPLKQRKITLPLSNHAGHIQWIKVTTYPAIKDSRGSIIKGGLVSGAESWTYDEYGDEIEHDTYNTSDSLSRKITHKYYPNGDIMEVNDSSGPIKIGIESEHCVGCKGSIMGYKIQTRIYNKKYTYHYDYSGNLLDSAKYESWNAPYCTRAKYFYNRAGEMLEEPIFRGNDTINLNASTLFRYNEMGQLIEKDEGARNYAINDKETRPTEKTVYTRDTKGRVIDAATYRYIKGIIYDVKTIFDVSEITTVKTDYLGSNNSIIKTDVKQFLKTHTLQEDTYDANGMLTAYTISHFDSAEHLLNKGKFHISYHTAQQGDTIIDEHLVNDKHFNVVEDDYYDGSDKIVTENRYTYKYDSVGNWVSQLLTTNGKPQTITERDIHYFTY
jgi:hypothetical protein